MHVLASLIVDEANWLPFSMIVALVSVLLVLSRHRGSGLDTRMRILTALNLFFGLTIGIMAMGHLLAVSVKFASGTLRANPLFLYAIGVLLAVPAWGLVIHARRLLYSDALQIRMTLLLNSWLAVTLLGLGLHNFPIAMPALFNIGYALHSRRAVGWAIFGVAVAMHAGLFIGGLLFMASGQTFEQFTGMR